MAEVFKSQNPTSVASPINQGEINYLLSQAKSGQQVSSILMEHGYSPELKNMAIHVMQPGLDFSGCHFDHVSLSGSLKGAHFNHNTFHHVSFEQADLQQAVFNQATFEQSHFHEASLNQASFIDSQLSTSTLIKCDLSDASFYHTQLNSTVFAQVNFNNVLDLENDLTHVHLLMTANEQALDYAMLGASFEEVKPSIATTDDGDWALAAHEDLAQSGSRVSCIDLDEFLLEFGHEPMASQVGLKALTDEINAAIAHAEQNPDQELRIVQQVLAANTPNIQMIKNFAADYVQQADSVFIPGGEDIIESFYGKHQFKENQFMDYGDSIELDDGQSINIYELFHAKQLIEFALIDSAFAADKPVMGVCHGAQLINVYFGGTLKDVDGQFGIYPELQIHTNNGVLGELVEEGMIGPSYHFQAVDKLGNGLEVVASYDGVVKGVQASNGMPLIMTQFHPEMHVDEVSTKIMKAFLDMSLESAVMSKVIELKDVLGIDNDLFVSQLDSPLGQSSVSASDYSAEDSELIFAPMLMSNDQWMVEQPVPALY